ncbi:unnamed protein product, partial [Vitrella brassicaformis CCMP3155]
VRVPGIGASVRPSVHLSRREARMKVSLSMSLATSAEERHRVVDLSFLDLIGRKRQLSSNQDARLHVILLNRPLPDCVPALMRLSTIVVCADGGANRLYDQFTREHEARINGKQKSDNGHDDSTPLERIDEAAIPQPARSMSVPAIKHKRDGSRCEHAGRLSLIRRATRRPSMMSLAAFVGPDEPLLLPSHICGDLDSVRPDVLEYFKDREVSILHDRDQDTNDLEKCFQFVRSEFQTGDKVVVVGAFGGRFDQTICNCHLLGGGNESRSVHTEGFRWNIRGSSLSMTSQLSSSNQVQTTPVEVTTTEPLLWYSEVLDKKMDEPSPEKTPISEASPITRRMATLPPKL